MSCDHGRPVPTVGAPATETEGDGLAIKTLSAREITEEFGLSHATIYRLRSDGRLTPLKLIGRRAVRYNRDEVERLLVPQQRKQEQ